VIEFINPPGRITHAVKPRPINNYFPSPHLVYCVTQKALAQLAPGRAVAPAGLGVGGFAIGFQKTRNGKPGALYELMVTSLGGTTEGDGTFLTMAVSQITPTQPIEIIESEYPVEVLRFEPLCDSAGAGRNRGGPGYLRQYRLLEDAVVTVRMGHFANGGWGIVGGAAPNLTGAVFNAGTEREEKLPIMVTRPLKAGDTVSLTLAGGYGAPAERAAQRVASDVRDGLVSVDAARERYRVAIDQAQLTLDEAATRRLRAQG